MKVVIEGKKHIDALSVHRFLAETLDFPGYCGDNANALWDTLTCIVDVKHVDFEWIDFSLSAERLGEYADTIYEVFVDAEREGYIKSIRKFL